MATKREIATNSQRDAVKQKEEAVNEECSNAGGHWHPIAGTLACQDVGFTLEPPGLCCEKTPWA